VPKDDRDDPKKVDDYLATVPDEARATLEQLRATIRAAAPSATEGFSYGIPAFRLGGRPLVSYAALKNHCLFERSVMWRLGDNPFDWRAETVQDHEGRRDDFNAYIPDLVSALEATE
jgi:hypothetical protein